MDKLAAKALEERLLQRAKEKGAKSLKITSDSPKPLYLQDLEERARQQDTSIDQVYERDQQLLSQGKPTSECLRPEEVMQCVQDDKELPVRAWKHYNQCSYCHGLVAFARPDITRFRDLVDQLATFQGEETNIASPTRVETWTDSFFKKLDTRIPLAIKGMGLLTACFLFVFYFSPNWVRNKAPVWAWSNYQLAQHTQLSLQRGDPARAETFATELIRRQPYNPGWYLYRSKARHQEGKEDLAWKDFVEGNKLLKVSGSMAVSAEWEKKLYEIMKENK